MEKKRHWLSLPGEQEEDHGGILMGMGEEGCRISGTEEDELDRRTDRQLERLGQRTYGLRGLATKKPNSAACSR